MCQVEQKAGDQSPLPSQIDVWEAPDATNELAAVSALPGKYLVGSNLSYFLKALIVPGEKTTTTRMLFLDEALVTPCNEGTSFFKKNPV